MLVWLVALNQRPALISVGATLTDIAASTGMPSAMGAVLVVAPLPCFAVGGVLAGWLHTRLGAARTIAVALAAMAVALVVRVVGGVGVLIGGTVIACVGLVVVACMLPVVCRAAPVERWRTLTACHTTAIGCGSGLAALVTPILSGITSWRVGVGSWAALAAGSWVAWVVYARRLGGEDEASESVGGGAVCRLRPVWMVLSVVSHFGLVCGGAFGVLGGWLTQVLRERAGTSGETTAGIFSVAVMLGIAVMAVVPYATGRRRGESALAVGLTAPIAVGVGGLLVAPAVVPWMWASLAGIGVGGAVALAITLIGLRTERSSDTAALSVATYGAGFALATAVALGIGLLHSATGSWHWPLVALLGVLGGQAVTGVLAGAPRTVAARAGAR